jgi:hypothetical protein
MIAGSGVRVISSGCSDIGPSLAVWLDYAASVSFSR